MTWDRDDWYKGQSEKVRIALDGAPSPQEVVDHIMAQPKERLSSTHYYNPTNNTRCLAGWAINLAGLEGTHGMTKPIVAAYIMDVDPDFVLFQAQSESEESTYRQRIADYWPGVVQRPTMEIDEATEVVLREVARGERPYLGSLALLDALAKEFVKQNPEPVFEPVEGQWITWGPGQFRRKFVGYEAVYGNMITRSSADKFCVWTGPINNLRDASEDSDWDSNDGSV